jgi:prophage antirepressor-like protein
MNNVTDANFIVKAFENSDITILNNNSKYYFRATDLASILNITNVYRTINDYSDKEKVTLKIETSGGPQNVMFLTSRGVYRMLYASKSNIAVKFRDWVGDILDDIFFNEAIELKKQIDNYHQKLLEMEDVYRMDKHNTLVNSYDKRPVVYLICLGNNRIKYGKSNNLRDRINTHKRVFGEHIVLIYVIESKYNGQLETQLQRNKQVAQRIINVQDNSGDNHREIIQLDETFTEKELIQTLEYIHRDIIFENEEKEKQVTQRLDTLTSDVLNIRMLIRDEVKQAVIESINTQTPTIQNNPTTENNSSVGIRNSLQPLPRDIEDLRSFYLQWSSEMKQSYEQHHQTYHCFRWKDVFAEQGNIMGKRHHMMKDWLTFMDSNTQSTEQLLTLFETFANETNLPHTSVIKKCFYSALRPNKYIEPRYQELITKLVNAIKDAGFEMPKLETN